MSVMARYADYDGDEDKPAAAISFGTMFPQALGITTTGENAIDPSLFEPAGGALATEMTTTQAVPMPTSTTSSTTKTSRSRHW